MSSNCPYCGATLNFGLKFCVVCGRQTAATNKMGGSILKSGARQMDSTRRIDEDTASALVRNKRHALRFRKGVRTLGQTIFYGFVAGSLFFCAVRFAVEAVFPAGMPHVMPKMKIPFVPVNADEDEGETAPIETAQKPPPKKPAPKTKKQSRRHVRHHSAQPAGQHHTKTAP